MTTVVPVMPYTRPRRKEGFFSTRDFVYDEYYGTGIIRPEFLLQPTEFVNEKSPFSGECLKKDFVYGLKRLSKIIFFAEWEFVCLC